MVNHAAFEHIFKVLHYKISSTSGDYALPTPIGLNGLFSELTFLGLCIVDRVGVSPVVAWAAWSNILTPNLAKKNRLILNSNDKLLTS